METLPSLFDGIDPNPPDFDGDSYDPATDRYRLTKQLGRVYSVMADGRHLTLREIALQIHRATGKHDSEAGISARLRDLRKARFGGYDVRKQRRNGAGTWEYWMVQG